MPLEERWSARFFELNQVFTDLNIENSEFYEASDFYNLADWSSYRDFMGTELAKSIKRPTKAFFTYREFNSIAKDTE